MGKHPCTGRVLLFWGKCRNLLSTKNKDKDNAPPFVEISEIVDESVQPIEERPAPDLPLDIITNILIRLPPKCIFRLRQQTNLNDDVLYDLTKDPYFMRTHLDRATPTIVVQSLSQSVDKDIKLYLFDDKAENVEETSLDLSSCNPYCEGPIDLWGSYEGFLLFKSKASPTPVFCIWNPITKEQVTVTSPSCLSYVFGFYFHPRKKEYQVISVVPLTCTLSDFQILSLRSKHRRSVGSCSSPPRTERSPAFINGTFYWMVGNCSSHCLENHVHHSLSDSILSFNIETEEFGTIEAVMPDSPPKRRCRGYQFQLFELEGNLSLFDPSSSTEVIIWVFNYSTRHWDKKHSMTPLWFPYHKHHWCFYMHFTEIEYIKTKGEFLAYHSRRTYNRRPFIYNLRSSTWKLFEQKGFEKDRIRATIYTQSLVSLDAADSVIPLVES